MSDEIRSVPYTAPDMNSIALLLEEKQYAALKLLLSRTHPADIAETLENIDQIYFLRAFRLLTKALAAEVFVELSPERQELVIGSYTDAELSGMLSELYIDDTVDLIEEMPANIVKRILRTSSAQDRATINHLLRYEKDSAGSMMTTEYVRLRADMTVADALAHIRRVAIDKETIYTCYITDNERRLIGIVTAKDLLLASYETHLSDIMTTTVVSLSTENDREMVAQFFEKYGFLAIPVVDREQRLVGIVTVDDAIEAMHEEVEEDFAKMAAVTPTDEPYLKNSVLSIFRARIPWLLILMISATFSSMILSFFESALPAVLILFVPMLMDTGGNSGGQASVTLIRALSLGEVSFSDVLRVLWKELRVALLCGVILCAVAFGKILLIDNLLMGNPSVTFTVALAVSVTLLVTIVMAKLIGSSLPILASRIGLDPAVMASPFITTLVDVVSLVFFFFISKTILGL